MWDRPAQAVTFVENHDVVRDSPIINDKLLGYAFILTHEGYPAFSGRITLTGISPSQIIKAASTPLSKFTNKMPPARPKCFLSMMISTSCNVPASAAKAG